MIDKLFSRTSAQINDLEKELDKLLSTDTKDTTENMEDYEHKKTNDK